MNTAAHQVAALTRLYSPSVRVFIVTIGRWSSGPMVYESPQNAYDQEVIAARSFGFVGGEVEVKELHKDGYEVHKVRT